nr:DGQHR domain-containing protein [Carnobacterium maltaromaticum]
MIEFKYIKISQPVGKFYLGKMKVSEIDKISFSNERTPYNSEGIQRKLDDNRINQISKYASMSDAIFPTAIVLSVPSNMVKINSGDNVMEFVENKYLCSIIDGQHRIRGIVASGREEDFEVPVVVVFDTSLQTDAEIFSVINGNQKPVSKSLVYDLYGLSKKRTLQKVAHEIVKTLNTEFDSLLKGRVKMLGIKDETSPLAEVSQSTMVDGLINLMSKNIEEDNNILKMGGIPQKYFDDEKRKFVFREWFIEEQDAIILKILRNYFNAWVKAREVIFSNTEPKYFTKTIGYIATFQLFRAIFNEGQKEGKATEQFYEDKLVTILEQFKLSKMDDLSRDKYGSSYQGARELAIDLIECGLKTNVISEGSLLNADLKALEKKGDKEFFF